MKDVNDKVVGCFFGMAVGDAMGTGVRGLKREAITQCFKRMDDFKDVRPFLGKGIKQYRMQGLYSCLTQSALVVGDSLLINRKVDVLDISKKLSEMSKGGSENSFGVFRHSRGSFRKSIEEIPNRLNPLIADFRNDFCDFTAMSIPPALYFKNKRTAIIKACIDVGILMSKHPWEIIGLALNGFIIDQLLKEEVSDLDSHSLNSEKILSAAVEYCNEVENFFQEIYPGLWIEMGERAPAISRTLRALFDKINGLDEGNLSKWICENASGYLKVPVMHPSQGYVLTLMPLAISHLLKPEQNFSSILANTLGQGRETDKLGIMVGAWAGALCGYEGIPAKFKTGLVNSNEIRVRGEALGKRKQSKKLKDIYEMESGLTYKEFEDSRKFISKKTKKQIQKPVKSMGVLDEENVLDPLIPGKEDVYGWRKFHRDKSKNKRDRRRNMEIIDDKDDEE
ncbi:MAG: ADP-ribosylglycohydrolase family protein [Nitrospinales bacterium]